MTLFELLTENQNDLSNHDLAHLADWANDWKNNSPNPDWKRAFALIREGADLLLRRRAMSRCVLENHIGEIPRVSNRGYLLIGSEPEPPIRKVVAKK